MPKKPKFREPVPDADSPEWTRDMFRRAKRIDELPENVQAALKRKGRGPQKAPTKKLVSIRLSPDVLEAVRATGNGWQVRIDETLRAQFVQEHSSTSTKKTRRKVA
jgi:uncharacterized protein (DUF4415 family)